jgi:hypothetical protein
MPGWLFGLAAAGPLAAGLVAGALPALASSGAVAAEHAVPSPSLVWATAEPAQSPPSLAYSVAAYDVATDTVVLFGGVEANGGLSDDTWAWDGTTWTEFPAGAATQAPPARQRASMAFDSALGQVILFGGFDSGGNPLSDTWGWNGRSWNPLSTVQIPPARGGGAMAADAAGDVLLFGGTGAATLTSPSTTTAIGPAPAGTLAPTVLGDTWIWTSNGWSAVTATPGESDPTARTGASMAYDPASNTVVLFGGQSTPEGARGAGSPAARPLSDIWTWNGSSWRKVNSRSGPPARSAAVIASDPAAGGVILAGGSGGAAGLGDTWLWAGGQWGRPAAPARTFPARSGAAFAYFPPGNQLIVFGGTRDGSAPLSDTLVLASAAGSSGTSPRSPGAGGPAGGGQSGAVALPKGAARAAPNAVALPPPLRAASRVLHRGQSDRLTGSGFRPGAVVTITFHSTPQYLGQTRADAEGRFSITVSVPESAAFGRHHFEAAGRTDNGSVARVMTDVEVVGTSRGASVTDVQKVVLLGIAIGVPVAAWLAIGSISSMRRRARRSARTSA